MAGPDGSHQTGRDLERALLDRHVRVLFDLDPDGRLTGTNEPEGDPAPRLFLARGRSGHLLVTRTGVPPDTVAACERIVAGLPGWDGRPTPPAKTGELRAVLAIGDTAPEVSGGPAFEFGARVEVPMPDGLMVVDRGSAALLEAHFPFTRRVLAARSPVVGVVRDGAIVAACYSARSRADACEAGVATIAAWQCHGFGRSVVAGWRAAVEASGRVPLYSTTWDDAPSLALARALRLTAYADTLSLR